MPPEALDAAIIFAPVGALVRKRSRGAKGWPRRLRRHPHERHPAISLQPLWEERQLLSVANLTRRDATDFLGVAPQAGVKTTTTVYPLERANDALADLRAGRFQGAAVLVP